MKSGYRTRSTFLDRLACVSLVLLATACQPMGPMPGGELSGDVAAVPADWGNLAAVEVVQLETQPSDPYSVNIWGVGLGPDYYVAAGAGETTWSAHIAADPNVRLKIGEAVYELRATRVQDEAELARVRSAYENKYEMTDEQRESSGTASVFRLDRRA